LATVLATELQRMPLVCLPLAFFGEVTRKKACELLRLRIFARQWRSSDSYYLAREIK
jgi:hypothetical protein